MRRLAIVLAGLALAGPAIGADEPFRIALTVRGHRFIPDELRVPAGRSVLIDVTNEDPTAEEFDSSDLGVEKIVAAGRKMTVRLHPLEPGRYKFIGEFNADTAQGVVIAEPAR